MPNPRTPRVPEHILQELRSSIRKPVPSARVIAPAPAHPIDAWVPHRPLAKHVVILPPTHWQGFWSLAPWLLAAGAVIAGILWISQYGVNLKGHVIEQGNAAVGHLLAARDDLQSFDFPAAKDSLTKSASEFDTASKELNALGPAVTSVISHIPGLSALRVGQDALKAGRLLSDAGLALSEALDVTTATGGLLDTNATNRTSLGSVFLPLEDALRRAQDDVAQASELVGGIDIASLPVQYHEQFKDLQDRLPTVRLLVDRAVQTTAFLSRLTGADRPRRYLILFSNSSELRPTGGFPGSYGLITFENGRVKDFRADDIYNPDGQNKKLIVPPLQLQHITPSWGMRDAAWWVDFPTSAKKVMQFWQHDGGAAVDGVLTIKPEILKGILEVTGPISLPSYGTVLTADNVLASLQLEVESKKTAQPKQIIVDLAPLILKRLSSAPPLQWVALLGLFKEGLDRRDILMYFDDAQLASYVAQEGYNGAVAQTAGDYLMVDISNIMGAKSDAVTDTTIKEESWMEDGTMVHRLTLTRNHNGGSTDYGFYNKPNHSFVRVLVPEGSVLRGITGNEIPSYRPLMNYSNTAADRDPELQALESTYQNSANGSVTYQESGHTGFGFWMSVTPGSTGAVQLEYSVPAKYISNDYHLTVQRQPGLDLTDFELTMQKGPGLKITASQPPMTEWPDSWRLNDTLKRDLEVTARLH